LRPSIECGPAVQSTLTPETGAVGTTSEGHVGTGRLNHRIFYPLKGLGVLCSEHLPQARAPGSNPPPAAKPTTQTPPSETAPPRLRVTTQQLLSSRSAGWRPCMTALLLDLLLSGGESVPVDVPALLIVLFRFAYLVRLEGFEPRPSVPKRAGPCLHHVWPPGWPGCLISPLFEMPSPPCRRSIRHLLAPARRGRSWRCAATARWGPHCWATPVQSSGQPLDEVFKGLVWELEALG
jgi:hypothetical protein